MQADSINDSSSDQYEQKGSPQQIYGAVLESKNLI